MKKTLLFWSIIFSFSSVFSQNEQWLEFDINLDHIQTRKDSFHMIVNDKVVGYWIWDTSKDAAHITFRDISVMTNVVEENFTLTMDTKSMQSREVDMVMTAGANQLKLNASRKSNKHLKADLEVSGATNRKISIDTTYASKVILRPEIFGLIPSITDYKNINKNINAFFMSNARIANMNLSYLGDEKIEVEAGEFDTYKIAFKGQGQVSNIIYIKKEFPRRIVKVDIIGQPLTIELTKL